MKAERRHELKTNTLAKGLEGLPEAGRRYGSRALLGLIAVLLVAVLVRFWVTRSRDAARDAAVGLDNARRLIDQMPTLAAVGVSQPDRAEAVAQQRDQVVQNVGQMVETALDKSSDPKIRAAAFIARGDLNWQLANFPELPGATTRPALMLPPRETFLKAAEEAYQTVVNNPGGAPPESVVFARLGLGAVAENRQQWDEAQKQYQAINDSETLPQPLRQLAADELSRLAEIRQPLVLAAPRTAPSSPQQTLEDLLRQSRAAGTQPTTRSIMLEPFTAPATAPATQPAATTAPATTTSAPSPSGQP